MIESLEGILEQLCDAQWHSIDEIKKNTSQPYDTLNKLLLFLQEQEFIEKKNEYLRITSFGINLMELPLELYSNPVTQPLSSKSLISG